VGWRTLGPSTLLCDATGAGLLPSELPPWVDTSATDIIPLCQGDDKYSGVEVAP
jgi:hypothetical protein